MTTLRTKGFFGGVVLLVPEVDSTESPNTPGSSGRNRESNRTRIEGRSYFKTFLEVLRNSPSQSLERKHCQNALKQGDSQYPLKLAFLRIVA